MLRTIRRDLAKYEEMLLSDPESREKAGGEVDSGWKVLKSDVFRAPSKPFLLSMMVRTFLPPCPMPILRPLIPIAEQTRYEFPGCR